MGLTEDQFWRMQPVAFDRMREGHARRKRQADDHFRQSFAQTHNHFQLLNYKQPQLLEPIDVIRFPGERRKRAKKATGPLTWSMEAIREAERKASTPPPTTD